MKRVSIKIANAFTILFVLFSCLSIANAQDLKAEDIIARHLASIGSEEIRRAVKNRVAVGTSEFIMKVPYAKISGRTVLASEPDNLLFASTFDSLDYPMERIGLFKNKLTVPFMKAGARAPLGTYLLSNKKIVSEGLLAGSILPSWFAANAKSSRAKIETDGRKKIGDRDAYVLKYLPKGGSEAEATIKLFFDAETFRHLRTEYRQKAPTPKSYPIGTFGQAEQMGGGNAFIEEFGDFRDEKGLMLPHSYKVSLLVDGRTGTHEFQWNTVIDQYLFDQTFKENFFSFDN